ncbi:hypothetical protein HanIR_Chr15g0759891 [Helianthus annuus]|nr:hypothetical protein HanIR_Chr15g0759891 [Helianthus annuus]
MRKGSRTTMTTMMAAPASSTTAWFRSSGSVRHSDGSGNLGSGFCLVLFHL